MSSLEEDLMHAEHDRLMSESDVPDPELLPVAVGITAKHVSIVDDLVDRVKGMLNQNYSVRKSEIAESAYSGTEETVHLEINGVRLMLHIQTPKEK